MTYPLLAFVNKLLKSNNNLFRATEILGSNMIVIEYISIPDFYLSIIASKIMGLNFYFSNVFPLIDKL